MCNEIRLKFRTAPAQNQQNGKNSHFAYVSVLFCTYLDWSNISLKPVVSEAIPDINVMPSEN